MLKCSYLLTFFQIRLRVPKSIPENGTKPNHKELENDLIVKSNFFNDYRFNIICN